jgi:hypothetical protein
MLHVCIPAAFLNEQGCKRILQGYTLPMNKKRKISGTG